VGLITGLLTLPLAPVRGTVWLAEVVMAEAEKSENDEASIMASLAGLEAARDAGELDEREVEEAEDALIERLMAIRGVRKQETHGQL
jgi:hypothetical protein